MAAAVAEVEIARSKGPGSDLAQRGHQFFVDVLVHAAQIDGPGRIGSQEDLRQTDGAQRLGESFGKNAVLRQDHFGAAAADVHHQNAFAGLRPARQHAQVNQPRFFLSRDDFHRRTQRLRRALQKLLLIAGVAHRAGSHRAHADDIQLLVDLRHALQIGAYERHGVGGDAAIVEHARAQTRHLPLGGQDLGDHASARFGGLHAYGVAANIDGGVTRHTHIVSWPFLCSARNSSKRYNVLCASPLCRS